MFIGVLGAIATKQANITIIPPIQIRNTRNAIHDDKDEPKSNATDKAIIRMVKASVNGLIISQVIDAVVHMIAIIVIVIIYNLKS